MGSASDREHCEKIKKQLAKYQIPTEMRVTSAHKNTDQVRPPSAQRLAVKCRQVANTQLSYIPNEYF